MDLLQDNELIHARGYARNKIEGRIPAVNKLVGALFNDVAHFRLTRQHVAGNIPKNTSLFRLGIRREEL